MAGKRELALQTDIIRSVRQQGGWARKMSNRFLVGMPDLVMALHPFAICIAEVKDLGPVTEKFDRKLDVSPKQRHELRMIHVAYWDKMNIYTPKRRASLLLVGATLGRRHMLTALPWDAKRVTYEATWVDRQVGGVYDIKALLEMADVVGVKQ